MVGHRYVGNSIPKGTVGGDLLEYINFQRRYNIDGRITRALKLAKVYLAPLPLGNRLANTTNGSRIQKSEKLRAVANRGRSSGVKDSSAGVLLVDAQLVQSLEKLLKTMVGAIAIKDRIDGEVFHPDARSPYAACSHLNVSSSLSSAA